MSSASNQLADTFGIQLTDELISWFDSGLAKNLSIGGFNEFINPEEIPGAIWGGMMLPDTLPIAGNGSGDVLCLRIASDGTLSEVLRWTHENGMWTPWGKTLSEALLWNITAITDSEDYWEDAFRQSDPVFSWILEWVLADESKRKELRSVLLNKQIPGIPRLLDFGLCEIAVLKHMCQKCLSHPLLELAHRQGGITIANHLGVDWNTLQPWLNDPGLIPEDYRDSLAKYIGISVNELISVDWQGAAKWAETVVSTRNDLAWSFVVLGKYAEKQGDEKRAAEHFLSEMQAFMTTYDFTEPWFTPPKSRMSKLEQVEHLLTDSKIIKSLKIKAKLGGRDYWLEQARTAEKQNNYPLAYRCWYAAGWDEFFTDDMDVILQGLMDSAEAAGYGTLAKIAGCHLDTLNL